GGVSSQSLPLGPGGSSMSRRLVVVKFEGPRFVSAPRIGDFPPDWAASSRSNLGSGRGVGVPPTLKLDIVVHLESVVGAGGTVKVLGHFRNGPGSHRSAGEQAPRRAPPHGGGSPVNPARSTSGSPGPGRSSRRRSGRAPGRTPRSAARPGDPRPVRAPCGR